MPATLSPPKSAIPSVRLLERATGIGRVDAEHGVIHNVKICGLQSSNKGRTIGLNARDFGDAVNQPYSYSREALKEAIPLYEGSPVKFDHPQTMIGPGGKRVVTSRSRPALSTVGQLKDVRLEADGLRGDIHLLISHPHSAIVLEVAERMPQLLSLSHNADGVPVLKDGRAVIEKIRRVFSVDLIGDTPGTTDGLFESEAPSTEDRKMEATEMTVDALREEILAVLDEVVMDNGDKLERIRALVEGGGSAAGEAATNRTMESAALIESMNREVTSVRIEAVCGMRSDLAKKALVESWPKKGADRSALRPSFSRPLVESLADNFEQAPDAESFARSILAPH